MILNFFEKKKFGFSMSGSGILTKQKAIGFEENVRASFPLEHSILPSFQKQRCDTSHPLEAKRDILWTVGRYERGIALVTCSMAGAGALGHSPLR